MRPGLRSRRTSQIARLRSLAGVAVVAAAAAIACSIGVRKDYSGIPAGQVGFDDLCGLQDYFDTIEARSAEPPNLVSAIDMENELDHRIRGGKQRYAFETEFQLKHLRRVLNENWNRLPEQLATAPEVQIDVHWSEKAGVKRVVTNTDAELIIGRESFALPYQACLSELLYGEPLYRQRRLMSGRPLPSRPLLGDAGLGGVGAPEASPIDTAARGDAAAAGSGVAPAARSPLPPAPTMVAPARVDAGSDARAVPIFHAAPPAN